MSRPREAPSAAGPSASPLSAAAAFCPGRTPLSPVPDCSHLLSRLSSAWSDTSLTPLFYGTAQLPDACYFSPYLHSATQQFLLHHGSGPPISDSDIVRYEVFTDGSGGSGKGPLAGPPSWAFVVCGVTCDDRFRIEGDLASPAPNLSDDYVSASGPSEFYAALWFFG